MRYRTLGTTGMQVSTLCLGAMMFGAWGNPDHDESIAIIHRALDAGINFVDTADVYSAGESEEIVGKALAGGRRDDVVLATKAHGAMGQDRNMRGNSRRWLVREVENSLRRLQTDRIDLYQIHRPDPSTSHEETLAALTDLQRAGKILAFGSSTYPAHQVVEAQWVARTRGLGRFVTEQPPYSMLVRGIERDLLPVGRAVRHGRAAVEPAGRRLAERPLPARPGAAADPPRRADAGALRPVHGREPAQAAARRRRWPGWPRAPGLTLVDLAVAFVLNHPAVTSAIIGPRTMEQLDRSSARPTSTCPPTCSTRSTPSSRPGRTRRPTTAARIPPALTDASLRRR